MVDRTVGEHIRALEQNLNSLSAQIMEESNLAKRNKLEAELRAVESALNLYQSALEVEGHLSKL